MSAMFWVWLGVIVATIILEACTMELVSIWLTAGAIIPFILAATNGVNWEVQLIIFISLSIIFIIALRKITKKALLKNSNGKTNLDALIGQKYRMLTETDFDSVGTVKINDVVWNAIGKNRQEIKAGEIVRIVKVRGNKLIVEKIDTEKE